MERSKDWLSQALRDLENAHYQLAGKYFEWATFIAQQAAEKAIKAVYQRYGGDAWGHSCQKLLVGIGEELNFAGVTEELLTAAKQLDRYYVPARYPDGWGSGAPKDYITEKDAKDAISAAEKIIRTCEGFLA